MSRFKRWVSTRGKSLLKCSVCGKEFERHNAHVRSVTVSCSRACSVLAKPKRKSNKIELKCGNCGEKFLIPQHRIETAKYCSWRCARKMSAPKGENHPRWRGGISKRTHSTRMAIEKRILEVGKCESCGETINLQGHHIVAHADSVSLRDTPSNIRVLCANCHSTEHPRLKHLIAIPRSRSGKNGNCQICGMEFYAPPKLIPTKRYCSHRCSLIGLHERTKGRPRKKRK